MGIVPIWTRSRVFIVALGLMTLLYALFLGLLYLRLPGDGYGIHLSSQGFAIDRVRAGGVLQKNDTVVYIGEEASQSQSQSQSQRFNDDLLRPGLWYRRIFGRTPTRSTSLIYTLLWDSEEQQAEVPLRRATLGNILSRTGILFFLGLVFVLNSLFIVLRRAKDQAGKLMAAALLAEGLNLINNTINLFSINVSVSLFWLFTPIDIISFWAAFGFLLHTALTFPKELAWVKRHPRAVWSIHALNPLVSGIGALLLGGGSVLGTRAAIFEIGYPLAGLQLFAALGLMVNAYRTADRPLIRNQVRWILWGIVVGVTGWLTLFVVPIIIVGNPLVDLSLAMIPLVAIPVTFTFAVTRYRLLEIDKLINRSLVYGTLSIFLVAVYFIAVALISRGLQLLTGGEDDTTAVFLSTLSVALVFALVRDRFQRIIDRTFYPGKLSFEQLLHQMGHELSTTLVFDELVTLLTSTVPQRVGVNGAVLFVLDQTEEQFLPHGAIRHIPPLRRTAELEQRLRNKQVLLADQDKESLSCFQNNSGLRLCLPLFSRGRLIGLYGFGPKASGNPYDGEEVQILRSYSHQVTIALENTRLYDQVERYSRSLEDLVRQRTQELEQAHETVAAERNKLDAVLNTITDALVVTDNQGNIALTNPVFEALIDRSADQLIGRSLSEAIANNELQTMVMKALADSRQVFSGDLTLGQFIYRASARALRTKAPAPTEKDTPSPVSRATSAHREQGISGVVTVLRDVTHEVAVDRMKTDFISVVSHELRTPLTSVLGFAKLIHRTFDRRIVPALQDGLSQQSDQHAKAVSPVSRKLERAVTRIYENLDIIENESMRLTRLINDVLDIAKMEAGKMEWREDRVNPVEVIQSAVASTSALAQAKNLPVRVELSFPTSPTKTGGRKKIPSLWGDHDRLVQVLTNLLSNAIKFTDEGHIEVKSRVIEASQLASLQATLDADPKPSSIILSDSSLLLTTVTDTGIGIAPENLSSLFEKFKQVGDTLTDRPRGTGLGLSICKEIIEHHGGTIWVESEPGVGSTFSVALPLSPDIALSSAQEPVSEVEKIREMEMDARWVRRRVSQHVPKAGDTAPLILVVDDEPNIRRLLNEELSEAGYRVIEAADGIQALAQARRQRPDLIILDVMMPGVSGFDVTSALKGDEQTSDIPILILSIVQDRQRGLRLGADEYLTKPVNVSHLLHTIAGLLKEVEIGPAADEGTTPGKKVLIVDKDASAVEAITQALRAQGFEVVEAYDPQGALRHLKAEKPDLVILDAMLSKMNDYELLKALRYQDHEQRMNIIVLSGETAAHNSMAPSD